MLNLKFTEGKNLKHAAIIMFGKYPMRFYPNIQVKIGRFGIDPADLRFQEVVEGNLVHMLHEVQVQLNYKFLTRPATFEGFMRKDNDLYPIEALREILLNALVNRTYMGATIQIRVYDDRLSIWNEGSLPYDLELEDLKREHSSRPRNPLLANACFLGGYTDAWGRGTLKIINSCKDAGLAKPEIKERDGGIAMTLFALHHPNDVAIATAQAEDEDQYFIQVLLFCSTPRTRDEIQEHVNISHREYFRKYILKPLLLNGKLLLTIPDKPTNPKQKYYTNPQEVV